MNERKKETLNANPVPVTLHALPQMADSCVFENEGRKEMFYLTTHSTHFIYGYMASDIWLRTILIVRKETRCRHMGYSFRLAAMVLLYAPSHRQDSIYHGLCYTSVECVVKKTFPSFLPNKPQWYTFLPAPMAQWLCHRLMDW